MRDCDFTVDPCPLIWKPVFVYKKRRYLFMSKISSGLYWSEGVVIVCGGKVSVLRVTVLHQFVESMVSISYSLHLHKVYAFSNPSKEEWEDSVGRSLGSECYPVLTTKPTSVGYRCQTRLTGFRFLQICQVVWPWVLGVKTEKSLGLPTERTIRLKIIQGWGLRCQGWGVLTLLLLHSTKTNTMNCAFFFFTKALC